MLYHLCRRRASIGLVTGLLVALQTVSLATTGSSVAETSAIDSRDPLPNYDIRWTHAPRTSNRHLNLQTQTARVPDRASRGLVIRWNNQLDRPHHIFSYSSPLTESSSDNAVKVAARFISDNQSLFGISERDIRSARTAAFEPSEQSGFTRVVFEQRSHGIRVFDSEMMFIIDRQGRLVSESGSFVPQLERADLRSSAPLNPGEAFLRAASHCSLTCTSTLAETEQPLQARTRTVFSSDEIDPRSEASLVYYPVTSDDVRLGYQVLLYPATNVFDSYLVVLDATSGELLRRQSLACAFDAPRGRVFTVENPQLADREVIQLAGDSAASPQGWIAGRATEGNNARVLFNPDLKGGAPVSANGSGEFDFPLDLAGGPPLNFANASATNLFYWVNFAHDRFYELGFDERARNFQSDNLGRGGIGGDPIRAETLRGAELDPSAAGGNPVRNNAFFVPTLDGGEPLLAMLMWSTAVNGTTTNLDGSYDASVIVHEFTHGVSTRISGTDNSLGLQSLQGDGMGEGWSDFFAMSFLDRGEEPIDSARPIGTYVTANTMRGARSYPYSTDFALNPLTFGDIAFNIEMHAVGTVWCEILWEVRQSLIARYGFEAGRDLAERLVLGGLKLTPLVPLMTDARDAILLADRTMNAGVNQALLWQAFARRGLGASALTSLANPAFGYGFVAEESYDVPPEVSAGSLTINEKPPAVAVVGEALPVLVIDRDLAGMRTAEVTATNLRNGLSARLTLNESHAGRFDGAFRIPLPQETSPLASLMAEPGDVVSLVYNNERDEAGSSETVQMQVVVGRRVVAYSEDFERGSPGWLFTPNVDGTPNYWHVSNRQAQASNASLSFSKEKTFRSFTPQGSHGTAVVPTFSLSGLVKPRLEFDWTFNGFAGSPTASADSVRLTASNARASVRDPALTVAFSFRAATQQPFQHAAVDLR
ncbi:MAG TPA: M36 family metallopeptidase, partial [Blastocatellia bacterium]|nr:M36 family metallopeptidase [Blastocatellia bacterium]